MNADVHIIQLPFPDLESYFPVPEYFQSLENWYQKNLSPSCRVPNTGLWEAPPWITWVSAAFETVKSLSDSVFNVKIVDFSKYQQSSQRISAYIDNINPGDICCFSPLTQNYLFTQKIIAILLKRKVRVLVGGKINSQFALNPSVYTFNSRIEQQIPELFRLVSKRRNFSGDDITKKFEIQFARNLNWGWATNSYNRRTIYSRVFSHHGCPFSCDFCADRESGSYVVPKESLQSEIKSLSESFPDQSALYIGDLTFGINKAALKNLCASLLEYTKTNNKRFSLAVQTNPSLITEKFIDQLKELNVSVVEIGIESANAAVVRETHKHRPSEEWLLSKISMLRDADIAIAGNLCIGMPHETRESYQQTKEFVQVYKNTMWFNIYGFVPYPNTPLYAELVKNLSLIHI